MLLRIDMERPETEQKNKGEEEIFKVAYYW